MVKKKNRVIEITQLSNEALEELTALKAIYNEELSIHEDGRGFDISIIPHPTEPSHNFLSLVLQVR